MCTDSTVKTAIALLHPLHQAPDYGTEVASFPGLPVFVIQFNTRKQKSMKTVFFCALQFPFIILNTNQRTKPGEAWEQG